MWTVIHRVLGWHYPGPRPGRSLRWGFERIIPGTGIASEDILQEAAIDLCLYPAEQVLSWEALATVIARRRTIQAIRDASRTHGEDWGSSILAEVADSRYDPEAECIELLRVRDLMALVHQLDYRERLIFLGIHFEGRTRWEIGEELGLTGQRVGQIYNEVMRQLEADRRYPYRQEHHSPEQEPDGPSGESDD